MKVIYLFLAIILILPVFSSSVHAREKYSDINSSHWAFAEINYLSAKGIINGHSDGSFKPNKSINRIDAAKMIALALDLTIKNRPNPNFSDMKPGDYGYEYAATLSDEGIMTGRRGEFKPHEPLTRAEMAKIITIAFKLTFYHDAKFKDVPNDYWAFDYINILAANDITLGKERNIFAPNDFTTRAEFSVFMARALDDNFK
ncbi:S-layer homology domain-containing protein [Halalkalibacter urbisdiaboli]|uniref:S-layer homology domain-containing protein n=1 Tax=Halalkalibacter urbisdiaboli TaxID=1960589 RepID=UPI000B44E76D|nr:S-layer homology domain-containing protein [Halalkalibacter urbisdiaboli]